MAIAHVSTSTMAQVANGTGTTKTITTSAGDYLFATQAYFANSGTLTVSDDKSNTWAEAILGGSVGSNFNRASIWYAKVTTPGSTVVSWALPSGSYLSGAVCCFSGIATSSALDKTAQNSGAPEGLNDFATGSTTTLAQADELALIVLGSSQLGSATVSTFSPSGFSNLFDNKTGATIEWGKGDYKIVSATTAINPTYRMSSGGDFYSGVIATFKAAAGGTIVVKTFDGIAQASLKQIIGVASASAKTIDGIANV